MLTLLLLFLLLNYDYNNESILKSRFIIIIIMRHADSVVIRHPPETGRPLPSKYVIQILFLFIFYEMTSAM